MPPPRRRRLRKILKWTGLSLCALFAGLWLASLRWNVSYFERLHHRLDDDALAVRLERGALLFSTYDYAARYADMNGTIIWSDKTATRIGTGSVHDTVVIARDEGLVIKPAVPRTYWRPDMHSARFFAQLDVPLWLLLAVVALPTACLFWRDRRRYGPHQCQHCGYDLTGNTSGTCPECGSTTSARGKAR